MSEKASSLRVALLAPRYRPEAPSGTVRFAHALAGGLVARGHRPRLITSHPGLRPRRTVEGGIEVIRVPRKLEGQLQRRCFEEYMGHLPFSAVCLRGTRNDVAHALYPTDAMVAARWSRQSGRPSVFSYMGVPSRRWLVSRRMRLKSTFESARDCDAVVALSRAAAQEFRRTLAIHPRVISPGVDIDAFTPGGERSDRPTIFSSASLSAPHKRLRELVEAFPLVRRQRPDARLVMARPADPELARQVLDTDPGIELVEVDDGAALVREYRGAWLSALPSASEAFGLMLVESMACGTPAVGRRAGGIPEVVDRDEVGVLFEGGPEQLAKALLEGLELAGHPSTASACRTRAEDFSVDRCTTAYQDLYRELLQARGR